MLLVWELNRLSHKLRHVVDLIHKLALRDVGVRVLSGPGVPLDTPRDPDHVARVALFCASDLAAMCTGSTIAVDAGVLAAGLVDRRYEDDA